MIISSLDKDKSSLCLSINIIFGEFLRNRWTTLRYAIRLVLNSFFIMHILRYTFLLSCLGIVKSVNTEQAIFGKKLEGYIFRTVFKVSVEQCFDECRSRPYCASFNYARRFWLCELNSQHPTSAKLAYAVGYRYSLSKVWLYVLLDLKTTER